MDRPKTAFEACMQAADMIEGHPLNYVQQTFIATLDTHYYGLYGRDRDALDAALASDDNVCHTAYCRAGWVVLLVEGEDINGLLSMAPIPDDWEDNLHRLLGVTKADRIEAYKYTDEDDPLADIYEEEDDEEEDASRCFYDDISAMTSGHAVPHRYGTPEYHIAGAQGLRDFANRWAHRLVQVEYVYNADGKLMTVRAPGV